LKLTLSLKLKDFFMPDSDSSIYLDLEPTTARPSGPVVLLFIDSWGVAPLSDGNAFTGLNLNNLNKFLDNYPVAILAASGTPGERYQLLGAKGKLTALISEAGLKQRRLSESEATPFLEAYFLNGRSDLMAGESREIVSSLAGNRQEDFEEAAQVLVKKLIKAIKKGEDDFIVLSLSSLDLASESGDLEKSKEILKAFDLWLKKIVDTLFKYRGTLILTSAYGRAEALLNPSSGLVQTSITNNPVPFLIISQAHVGQTIGSDLLSEDLSLLSPSADLRDLAPTVLTLLNIKIPGDFPGESLL